jgi:glycosyltransferase involved in cell wall biosynthesis
MTPGRIAVAITCHNLGRTLVEALASVERQTRPASEIVVVDDASTEIYTRQVLARLERDGTRIVQAGGRGVSAARNLGARLTSAEYLVWLDADDVLEPGYFDAAAARLDADPDLHFVSCAMRAFGAANYLWSPSHPSFVDAVSTGAVPHASTMLRRRLWEGIGGFDEDLLSFELLDFWASVLERGFRGVVLDEPLLNYRVRSGSGYRRSIQPDVYLSRLGHLYAKHHEAVERHGQELLQAKEAFLLSQREYSQTLEARTAWLEAELTRLKLEIAEAARTLEARGLSRVNWGDLRRAQPFSQYWGWDRGQPIDRYYIEGFLDRHRADVRGRVLEVRDPVYTKQYGGNKVRTSDVVDVDPANGLATVVADLRRADAIPAATYDCIILTQTLHLIDDMAAVLAECARILRPGGVLLVTVPSVIAVDDGRPRRRLLAPDGSVGRILFAGAFPLDAFDVTAYGNVTRVERFSTGCPRKNWRRPISIMRIRYFPRHRHSGGEAGRRRGVRHIPVSECVGGFNSPRGHPGLPPGRRAHAGFPRVVHAPWRVPRAHGLPSSELHADRPGGSRARRRVRPDSRGRGCRHARRRIPGRSHCRLTDPHRARCARSSSTDRLDQGTSWWDLLERVFLSEMTLPPLLSLKVDGQELRMATTTAHSQGTLRTLNPRGHWTRARGRICARRPA